MDANKKYVIVPWDFTKEADYALQHAAQLAKVMKNGIILANIVHVKKGIFFSSKGISPEEKKNRLEKMENEAKEYSQKYGLEVKTMIIEGDIPEVFPQEVKNNHANLVIMPFRQRFGNFVFGGSKFLNIMKESIIPFIIVKNPPKHQYYKELVVPMDVDKKYKETIAWIIYLAHYYSCNINILKPFINESFAKKDMANNIYFTKKMLDKQNIIYGIKTAKKNHSFKEEIFRFAEMIDADLVVMMAKRYKSWIDSDKDIKLNIPIMVIPPRTDLIKYSAFA
ncbi:MAG TPA: universal stress protein [Salinivirgaceae bacterium]|nr:universal stress protein [Salinivirgaceae bacterium]